MPKNNRTAADDQAASEFEIDDAAPAAAPKKPTAVKSQAKPIAAAIKTATTVAQKIAASEARTLPQLMAELKNVREELEQHKTPSRARQIELRQAEKQLGQMIVAIQQCTKEPDFLEVAHFQTAQAHHADYVQQKRDRESLIKKLKAAAR